MMVSVKKHVTQTIEQLSDGELQLAAEYLAFLKFRARARSIAPLNETQLAAMYAEFSDEDYSLAEEGMEEYVTGLREEDKQ